MANDKSIIIKRGDRGPHVILIQKGLKEAGFWPSYIPFSERFGPTTDAQVRLYQGAKELTIDGKVGRYTLELLGVNVVAETEFDEKYKNVVIQGSVFPDKPIKNNVRVRLNKEMNEEYLPEMKSVMSNEARGFQLLITIMAYKEGFRKGTRSYRTNNPGNIGNTDSGANKHNGTLKSGIELQKIYVNRIVSGVHSAYPMNNRKYIKPFFSKEIAKHSKMYGMSPYLPGYDFIFTGQLDQFVKIYATGARAGNSYLSMIITYFKLNGIEINAQSKIQDIIKIK